MQKLQSGRISRRIFISNALAAGLAIPAALSLSGQALAQVPNKGGAIKFGFGSGSTTDFLDPATYEGTIKTAVAYLFGNNLVELDANGNLVPELATEYSSNDAITWVFTLREGVEFHNDQTLTPAVVIATIDHHCGEGSKSAVNGLVAQIKSMRADGNNVVFELDPANADFPSSCLAITWSLCLRPMAN